MSRYPTTSDQNKQPDHGVPRHRLSGQRAQAAALAALATPLTLALTLTLAACTTPPEQPQHPDPAPVDGGLFLSVAGDSQGLYIVDTATGAATRIGAGNTGTTASSPGLSPGAEPDQLFGNNDFELRKLAIDGSGWSAVGGNFAFTEGLAYDPVRVVLYAASNGFLQVRSPTTGMTQETWLGPPNEPDIEGLAFDPEMRILYGLARGYSDQPEFRQELYALNVEAAVPVWTTVGSTGGCGRAQASHSTRRSACSTRPAARATSALSIGSIPTRRPLPGSAQRGWRPPRAG